MSVLWVFFTPAAVGENKKPTAVAGDGVSEIFVKC